MTVNGEAIHYRLDPETPLLFALRDASNLTGTKHGCYSGDCGSCTVIADGRAVLSCQLTIAAAEGADITTIEGLSADRAHPLQQAWAAEQVSQCGRCDPGFIMALAALMRATPNPDARATVRIAQPLSLRRYPAHHQGYRARRRRCGACGPVTASASFKADLSNRQSSAMAHRRRSNLHATTHEVDRLWALIDA